MASPESRAPRRRGGYTRADASLLGQIGAHRRWATEDGVAGTAKARATYLESFEAGHGCNLCGPRIEIPPDLPAAERRRRGAHLKRAHYLRMAMASHQAKARKKAARERHPRTAKEVADADPAATG